MANATSEKGTVPGWRAAPAQVLSELAPTGLFWTPESRWYAPGPTGAEFWMDCVCCGSAAVAERPERTAQGYRRFRCRGCGKQFNERSAGLLNRTQYPSDTSSG